MEGLKTLILAGMGLLFAALAGMGIIVTDEDQLTIGLAVYAILVAVVRHFTEGKVWYKK